MPLTDPKMRTASVTNDPGVRPQKQGHNLYPRSYAPSGVKRLPVSLNHELHDGVLKHPPAN